MKNLRTILSVLLLVAVAILIWKNALLKSQEQIANNELRAFGFCGTLYYAEPVILFDTDLLSRIAEIATERPETNVCENLKSNVSDPSAPLTVTFKDIPSDPSGIRYYLHVEVLMFSFNPDTEEIFLHSGFDGTPKLLGTFRQ